MQLKGNLKTGDALVQYDSPFNSGWASWFNLPWVVAWLGITRYQEKYFGQNADTAADHVMLYIDDQHILNAVPPCVKWSTVDELASAKLKIFRPTFYSFTPEDAALMIKTFESPSTYTDTDGAQQTYTLIGSAYDYDQCADILIAGQLGKPCQESYELLGGGKDHIVCSVATATFFEKYKQLTNASYPNLFSKIKPEKFIGNLANLYKATPMGQAVVGSFNAQGFVAIEEITPAHYANSSFFDNSFTLIGQTF